METIAYHIVKSHKQPPERREFALSLVYKFNKIHNIVKGNSRGLEVERRYTPPKTVHLQSDRHLIERKKKRRIIVHSKNYTHMILCWIWRWLSRNAHANKTVLRKVTRPLALPTVNTEIRIREMTANATNKLSSLDSIAICKYWLLHCTCDTRKRNICVLWPLKHQ